MYGMRRVGLLLGSCSISVWMLVSCAKGVDGDTGGLTFGPVDSSNPATSSSVDPTTWGATSGDPDGGPATDEGTTDAVDPSTGPDEPSTSTGPAGPVCGDGLAEPGETCDGEDLTGLACPDVDAMFTGGTLACDAVCAFDTSGCTTAPNPIEVCQAVGGAIADNSTISNTIVLPPEQLGGTITDVDVEVELDHTFIGDLEIDVNANGTSVIVFSRCGSEDNLHATFDDEAGAGINCASSDAGLTVTPFSSLTALDGGAVTANWTLDVADQASVDQGSLQQWCLTISLM